MRGCETASGRNCLPRPFPTHQLTNSPTHQLTNSPLQRLSLRRIRRREQWILHWSRRTRRFLELREQVVETDRLGDAARFAEDAIGGRGVARRLEDFGEHQPR